jgi:NAD(P)-dependent dehydrogenase (short-subunit alcohol dehydrogenase family)
MFRLDGRVALITGGANGLGYAFATAVAEAGADVSIVDLDGKAAELAAEKLSSETGRKVIALQADVTKEEDTEQMVSETVKALGGLQICFANAGIVEKGRPIDEYDKKLWDQVIDVNLTGTFLTNRAVAKVMKQEKNGSIINTASIMGHVADQSMGVFAYTTSKGGVVQMTKTLAADLAPHGVRVNAISPGFIKTNISKLHDENTTDPAALAARNKFLSKTLLGYEGNPEQLKGIALFLASDASSYCTGYTYAVDGGYLAT